MNLMVKNALTCDIICSNYWKSSPLYLWSGQISSWCAPSAAGPWNGREERLSHLPGHREMKPHRKLKAPKPCQKPWCRGNARVGSAQMARKCTRPRCQRLKSNLSLLGLHTSTCCPQNRQLQTSGTHKVGEGQPQPDKLWGSPGYLTNANPPFFSCAWGGLSIQRECI